MSNDEQKLNRRVFLQYSAALSAATAGAASIAMKTDAIAQAPQRFTGKHGEGESPYPYQFGGG